MLSRGYKITQPKTFEIDIEDLKYKEGNAIVRIDYAAICKADLRYYLGNRDARILGLKYPMRLIHEATGTILQDPSGKFQQGEKVVLVPNMCNCTDCDFKHVSDKKLGANYCPKVKFASSNYDGFSAECVSFPINNLVRYDEEQIEGEVAVFCELISVVVACLRRVDTLDNKKIGIWGDGLLGYILAHVVKTVANNSEVICVGVEKEKLEKFDVDTVYMADTLNKMRLDLDIAFECVGGLGAEHAINQMIENVKFGGMLVLTGVSEQGANISTRRILEKAVTITGSTRSGVEDFEKAIEILGNVELKNKIKQLVLSINKINNVYDYYNAFEVEKNNKYLGKNILLLN